MTLGQRQHPCANSDPNPNPGKWMLTLPLHVSSSYIAKNTLCRVPLLS